MIRPLSIIATALLASFSASGTDPQYAAADISIPAADAREPLRESFSPDAATRYLENGTTAWQNAHGCVSCHTNGVYNQIRPALTGALGAPPKENHSFLLEELGRYQVLDRETLTRGLRPTQVAVLAHGMAEWDLHIGGGLNPKTREALDLMLSIQREDGSWGNAECWPPFESSAYHGATVAALALATAPEYLNSIGEPQQLAVEKLRRYLREQPPPHDYGRVLLLWASTRMAGLIDRATQEAIARTILGHQREDGGWSLRTFSAPEAWGNGRRAGRLKAEPDFATPPSDGHMTGLAILVLRESGLSSGHPAIQSGIAWLKANQRESGRWWTRSLNTDRHHFITYSGTMYPLAALAKCNALNVP